MKHFLLSALFAVFFSLPSGARTSSPALPVNPPANEISVAYGVVPAVDVAVVMANVFGTLFTFGLVSFDHFSSTGALSLEYFHTLGRVVSLGGVAAYSACSLDRTRIAEADADGNARYEKYGEAYRIVSLMPAAKASWFRKPRVSMYSKVAVGAMSMSMNTVSRDDAAAASETQSDYSFAFQLSPVAVDFGGPHFRGFVETGFGWQGMLLAGLRYSF